MSERHDVGAFKKLPSGKTIFIRCGSAMPRKDGDGWNVYLDAIPAPIDGQYQLAIVKPREKQGGGRGDIPFD